MNASIDFISTTIGDIADVISGPFGSQLHESDYKEHGTPIVTVEHLSPFGLTTQNLPFVGDEDKERLNRYTLKQGDIVFSRVGSVDRCSLVREKEEGWLFSGRLLRIRLNNSYKEMATLLSYIFQTNRFTHQVRSKAVGQTMPSLNNGIVKSLQISIPRNPQLQKIYCDTLINVDQKINLLTKKKEALETYKKGLMQKIFSQELRFKREDGTDYPEWRRMKLVDVCTKKNSGLAKGDLLDVGLNGVYGAAGDLEGYTNISSPSSAYVSIVKDGAGVGRVNFLPSNTSTIGTLDMIVADDELMSPYFLYSVLNNIRWEKYIVGSTIPHIYFRDWKNEKIKIPSLEEQWKIVKVISNLESNCYKIIQKIESTEQLKKGLLQQMFV